MARAVWISGGVVPAGLCVAKPADASPTPLPPMESVIPTTACPWEGSIKPGQPHIPHDHQPQRVLGAVGLIIHADGGEQVDQFAEHDLVQRRAGVLLGRHALEAVIALYPGRAWRRR